MRAAYKLYGGVVSGNYHGRKRIFKDMIVVFLEELERMRFGFQGDHAVRMVMVIVFAIMSDEFLNLMNVLFGHGQLDLMLEARCGECVNGYVLGSKL